MSYNKVSSELRDADNFLALVRILGDGFEQDIRDKIREFSNEVRISDEVFYDYNDSERLTQQSKDSMLIEMLQKAYAQGYITLTTTPHVYGTSVIVFASMLVVKRDLLQDSGLWGSIAKSIKIITESVSFSLYECTLQAEHIQYSEFKVLPVFLNRILAKLANRLVADKLIHYRIEHNKGEGFKDGTTDIKMSLLTIKPKNPILDKWIETNIDYFPER